jgi:hypothetical protein
MKLRAVPILKKWELRDKCQESGRIGFLNMQQSTDDPYLVSGTIKNVPILKRWKLRDKILQKYVNPLLGGCTHS